MKFPDEKVFILWRETYLAMINNSLGTKMFRNCYARVNGRRQDILRNGDLACAVYVSTILTFVQLLNCPHTTVTKTELAMKRAGWRRIKTPRAGAVIIWELKRWASGESHRHIGFFLQKGRAISNSPERGYPIIHHLTFG